MTSQNNEFPPLFHPVDTDWINNARIIKGDYRSEFYIRGYKKAADILVDHVLLTDSDLDTLVYPIVFLYRHYLELLVKNIIENGAKYLGIEEKPKTNHHLDTLWSKAKEIINKYKAYPLDEYYLLIEDAITRYKANPPDLIKPSMSDETYKIENEDPTRNEPYMFSNEPVDLDGLFTKFINCPNDVTAENFREGLKKYKLENPNGKTL